MSPLMALRALAVAAILVAVLVARRWAPATLIDNLSVALRSRWAPVVAGAITALLMAWVWGSLRGVPVVHDEIAYLTQARIYASFHLYAAARPLPEFFEQYHMFVTPHFMAKYPPGHAMSLVPGIWLGLPALMPLLFAGITGALTFALARRVTNEWVAFTTWMFWTTAPGVLSRLPSYFSQTTTCALWLLGWWAVLRWREERLRRWLLLLAACMGYGVLTHPFTWLLYSIPVGVVVLVTAARRRQWRDLGYAIAVGCTFLVVLVAWNTRTMGGPLRFPWSVYARTYFPFDQVGFGVDSTPPLRALPPDMVQFASMFRSVHAQHTVSTAPGQLVRQLRAVGDDLWRGWRLPLAFLALLGLAAMPAEIGFALASSAVVIGGYLLYAHPPQWTLYYLEIYPVLACVMALGAWRFLSFVGNAKPRLRDLLEVQPSRQAAMAILIIGLLFCPFYHSGAETMRQWHRLRSSQAGSFNSAVARLPGDRVVVFVRYSPSHNPNFTLIYNDPDLERSRAWLVHDRGPDDIRLIRLATGRVPYLFDQAASTIARMDTAIVAVQPALK